MVLVEKPQCCGQRYQQALKASDLARSSTITTTGPEDQTGSPGETALRRKGPSVLTLTVIGCGWYRQAYAPDPHWCHQPPPRNRVQATGCRWSMMVSEINAADLIEFNGKQLRRLLFSNHQWSQVCDPCQCRRIPSILQTPANKKPGSISVATYEPWQERAYPVLVGVFGGLQKPRSDYSSRCGVLNDVPNNNFGRRNLEAIAKATPAWSRYTNAATELLLGALLLDAGFESLSLLTTTSMRVRVWLLPDPGGHR